MKKNWLVLVLVISSLASCNGNHTLVQGSNNAAGTQTAMVVSPNVSLVETGTPTSKPSATLRPTVTETPTRSPLPSRTPTPSAIPFANAAHLNLNEQRALMNLVINSGKWEQLALPDQIASRWEEFARGEASLNPDETLLMSAFLAQWGELTHLIDISQLKSKAQFKFGTMLTPLDPTGDQIALFLTDDTSGSIRYLLIVRDAQANPVGLLIAPNIEGLGQRTSPDGAHIEYYEPKGRTMLKADARKLDISDLKEKKLRDRLVDLYPNKDYFAYSSYPRFFLPGDEIKAGFYGLEESLTAMQILQLNEAFALYDRPDLSILKSAFFGPEVSVIVTNITLGRAIGLTYTGTGVVEIDRQELFGNKYWIAMVLAHEASHVLQGALPDRVLSCSEIEKREVGNHKIPVDFYGWSAGELVQAVKDLRIGAYHVSLWMMNKMGMKDLQPFQEIIQTGKVNGQSVVIDCRFSGMR